MRLGHSFFDDPLQAPFAYICSYAAKTHVASVDNNARLGPAPLELEAPAMRYITLLPVRLAIVGIACVALRSGHGSYSHDMACQKSNVSDVKSQLQEALVKIDGMAHSLNVDQINIMSDS